MSTVLGAAYRPDLVSEWSISSEAMMVIERHMPIEGEVTEKIVRSICADGEAKAYCKRQIFRYFLQVSELDGRVLQGYLAPLWHGAAMTANEAKRDITKVATARIALGQYWAQGTVVIDEASN